MDRPTCHGCLHLYEEPDGAGGGIWRCDRRPGLVLAEWGHWVRGGREPRRRADDCYEPSQRMGRGGQG